MSISHGGLALTARMESRWLAYRKTAMFAKSNRGDAVRLLAKNIGAIGFDVVQWHRWSDDMGCIPFDVAIPSIRLAAYVVDPDVKDSDYSPEALLRSANRAQLSGWLVLLFVPSQVITGEATEIFLTIKEGMRR